MKFSKDVWITFCTQIVIVILGIITTMIIARALGPTGKGVYSLVILVNSLITMLGNLGIGIANIYFGGSKKYDFADLAANAFSSAFILGIPLSIAFLIYYFIVSPSFLADIEPRSIILGSIMIPLALLQVYFSHILLGQNRIKDYCLVGFMQNMIFTVLLLLALFVFKGGLFSVILAWAASLGVGSMFALFQVRRTTPVRLAFNPALFKESVKFGMQGYLGNMMQALSYRLNMFIIALFMTTAAVGYFSISTSVAEALLIVPSSIGIVIIARTPNLTAEAANMSTPRICRTAFLITAILALVLLMVAKPIIVTLFGSAFLPAVRPLYILLPGIVLSTIYVVLTNEMTGRGKPIINTIVTGIALIVTISLNLLLIPRMGIEGAALASTISYAVSALMTLVIFGKISKISIRDTILVTTEDIRLYHNIMRRVLKLR